MSIDEQLSAAGIEVEHFFIGGIYAKKMSGPAGVTIGKHTHDFDHMSTLMQGSVSVSIDGDVTIRTAPAIVEVKANKVHEITSTTPFVWLCIHATDETDPDRIDHVLKGEQ